MGLHHGAIAARKNIEASFDLKEIVGQNPSVVIHRKSTVGKPIRRATPRAEEFGVVIGVADAVNVSATEDPLGGGVELACTDL